MSASPALGTTKTAQPNQIPQDAGLTEYEAALVREQIGREPNALEWAMFGAMWSEHCAYKHSKMLLRALPSGSRTKSWNSLGLTPRTCHHGRTSSIGN